MRKKGNLSLILVMMITMLIPVNVFGAMPDGPVSVVMGDNYTENGIVAWSGDIPGKTIETYDGKSGWQTDPDNGAMYLYFDVSDSYIFGGSNTVKITIEYYDSSVSGDHGFKFSYDSTATPWSWSAAPTLLKGSNAWKTATYTINDAQFANRENGADFRIESDVPVCFASVTVEKIPQGSEAAKIRVNPTVVTMNVGDTQTVTATVYDENDQIINEANVNWSSSEPAVATVDNNGKITAIKPGTTTVNATYGELSAQVNVTVNHLNSGTVSVILGDNYAENGIAAWSGDGPGRTNETIDGKSGWQTNPASGAHYIYFNVSDSYLFGGKNTVKITVEYYDTPVSGNQGFLIAYDSTATPFAYTEKTLLKGSNTWKTVTYTIEDAQMTNRGNGADFRIETGVPICFASVTVEKIPTVSMRGAQVKTGNIFMEGENPAIQLVFDNQFDESQDLNVSYKVLDYGNSLVDIGEFDVHLSPNETGSIKSLTFGALPKGTYTVSVDAASPDASIKLHEDVHIGTITDLTGKAVHDFLGVNTHFNKGYGGWDVRMPLVKQAGAASIRDGYSGNDGHIDTALANGVSLLIVTSVDINEIQQAATRLKGKVDALEIGNELSSVYTPEEYYEILKAAYTAVKSVDPDMKVVGGVTFQYDEPWLKKLVDLGACDYLDAISFHVYSNKNPEGAGIINAFQDLRNYIKSKGITKEIELWLTETGWPTQDPNWGGFPEKISAAYAAQLYVANLANDVLIDKIYWYDFINDCTDQTFFECSQGLLHVDNSPKPSYVAFNAVSDILAGATFVQSYTTLDSDIRVYKFHRAADNQDILVLWANRDKQIGLKLGSGQLNVTDLFGNTKPYDVVDGIVTFTASAMPIYIEGNFTQDPALETPTFITDRSAVTAAPGEDVQIDITRTAGAENLSGHYVVDLPLGWRLKSGGPFSAGQMTDTLTISAPATKQSGEIRIYPTSASGDRYGSLRLQASMIDASAVEVAPVVNATGDGWDISVKIVNRNMQESMSGGKVTIMEPADMTGSATFAPIAPNSSATVKFPAPSIHSDSTTHIKVQIDRDDGYSQVIERNVSSLTAVKADTPIQIDGAIDTGEWNHAMSFKLDKASQVRLIDDWGGPDDLSATAYTKWDEDYLYLAVSVTDNTYYNTYLPGDLWKGDSIQFTIDPGRSAGPGSLGWSENNIALNSDTNSVMKTGGYGGNDLSDSLISIKRDGSKTNYEMAVKWTDILPAGMIPASGTDLGFSFLVNDNDGTLRRGWMEYMSGIGLTKDPNLYGDLILTDRNKLELEPSPPGTVMAEAALDANHTAHASIDAGGLQAAIQSSPDKTVKIIVTGAESAKGSTVDIPLEPIREAAVHQINNIEVNTGLAIFDITATALKKLKETSSTMQVSVSLVDPSTLTGKERDIVGSDHVYDFTLTVDSKKATPIGDKDVSVKVKANLPAGEDPNKAVVYCVDKDGRLVAVKNGSYDAATGMIQIQPPDIGK